MTPHPAPAKINLFLHVVGRRPDGYHLLQTVFRFLDFGDTVHIAPRSDGQVRRLGEIPGVPEDQDLAVRAARLLQAETGCALGADLRVEKRIPMGGGLGGGSSDAATVLLALNRLWGLDLPRRRLMELGLALGADVPVFVFGRAAFAEGVGEVLSPVELPPAWYAVLTPPVAVATARIFSDPELTRDTPPIKIAAFFAGVGHNDLEPVACRLHPEVRAALAALGRHGDARMTGSGGSVFAAFDSRERAEQAIADASDLCPGFVARGLDRHPLGDF